MASSRGRGRSAAPAASLLAPERKPAVPVVDKAATEDPSPSPVIVGAPPVAQVSVDEHQAKQREYRDWLAKMSRETPAQADTVDAAATTEPAEVVHIPTAEERKLRSQQEDLGAYLFACIEMPADEPRYYVGLRPPRPKWGRMILEIGDLVPGAALWPRLDSWLRAGIVVPEDQMRRVS